MRRLLSSVAAAIIVMIGTLSFLQPAHAAPGDITLVPSTTTAYVGQTITVDWTTEGLSLLRASGDLNLPNNAPTNGSIDITLTEVRMYTFTLGGDDVDGRPVDEVTVTVNVLEQELPPYQEADLVSFTASCGAVTFTNLTDDTVQLFYGLFTNDDPDGAREIAPGASVRIKTEHGTLDFSASSYEFVYQEGSVDLPSECATKDSKRTGNAGAWNNGPRVAPAAGVADNQGTLSWGVAAAASVLALGALALGRRFATR